jgi:hypothetical protein
VIVHQIRQNPTLSPSSFRRPCNNPSILVQPIGHAKSIRCDESAHYSGRELLSQSANACGLALAISLFVIPKPQALLLGVVVFVLLICPHFMRSIRVAQQVVVKNLSAHGALVIIVIGIAMLVANAQTLHSALFSASNDIELIMAVANPLIVISCVVTALAASKQSTVKGIIFLALTISFICLINILADIVNVHSETLKSRTAWFPSRYFEDAFRWQAPLISSAQLSGQGRWALPLLLLAAYLQKHSGLHRLFFLLAALLTALILFRLEYRAAGLPLLGFIIWLLCPSNKSRSIVAATMFSYMVAAPFLHTNRYILSYLDKYTPASLQLISGDSLQNLLTLSYRTHLWEAVIGELYAGRYWITGPGYTNIDASTFEVYLGPAQMIMDKVGLHQGYLELCYVYGITGASLLILAVASCFLIPVSQVQTISGRTVGLLSIGLVGVANAQDSFFEPNFLMFSILLFSIISVFQTRTRN